MIPLMQREILVFVDLWNSNCIRKEKGVALLEGIPNHIYDFPEDYGLENYCMFHVETVLLLSKCCYQLKTSPSFKISFFSDIQ